MAMTRRGFIGRLLASTVGLALAPDTLLWRPDGALTLPPVEPNALLTLEQLTRAFHARLLDGVRGTLTLVPETNISPELPHLLGIDMIPPTDVGPAGCLERHIDPAVAAMRLELSFRKMRRFGELPLPTSDVVEAARVSGNGLSVRGLRAFSILEGRYALRFSVLGG